MTAQDNLIGQQLDEYRLEGLLGKGGMARVYRAVDVRLKRYVAVKVIDTPFRAESEYTTRFEREAQAIAQLNHPHIVQLYRYGEADGVLYMAMQYVQGADLATILDSYRQHGELMPPADAVRVIREVCLALDYAHGRGVIHRDVKPSNIMLDKNSRSVLTDFGLSLLSELGTQGEVFGTPHYIAPEQAISSAGAVPQSDLYSIGVILYELFTGRLPFDGADVMDIAMRHLSESPPLPSTYRADINPELEAVIVKTLAKKPEERFPTGAALSKALERALHLAPTSILRPPTTAPSPYPTELRPRWRNTPCPRFPRPSSTVG
jgi:eukaryotic-like serine/threonine-protein kinase